jgi:hypothetical protein
MNRFHILAASLLFAFSTAEGAQPAVPAAALAVSPAEAHQFDFMLGQWTIEVHPKVSSLVAMIHGTPKLIGTWQAKRSANGVGIEDESRIVDGSGNPISLVRSQRTWVAADKRWKISGLDILRKRNTSAIAHWTGSEMQVTGSYVDDEGTPTQSRTRYCQITANRFRMVQDRSTDNGKTWDEGVLTIDARRSGSVALH